MSSCFLEPKVRIRTKRKRVRGRGRSADACDVQGLTLKSFTDPPHPKLNSSPRETHQTLRRDGSGRLLSAGALGVKHRFLYSGALKRTLVAARPFVTSPPKRD